MECVIAKGRSPEAIPALRIRLLRAIALAMTMLRAVTGATGCTCPSLTQDTDSGILWTFGA